MLLPVVTKVAALAQSSQVIEPVVVLILVDVGDREHHLGTCDRVGLVVVGAAPFALIQCPGEADQLTDQPPLWMVFFVVNGHKVDFGKMGGEREKNDFAGGKRCANVPTVPTRANTCQQKQGCANSF